MRFQLKNTPLEPTALTLSSDLSWAIESVAAALRSQSVDFSEIMLSGKLDLTPLCQTSLSVMGDLNIAFNVRCESCDAPFRLNLAFDIAEVFCSDTYAPAQSTHFPVGVDITYVTQDEIDLAELIGERIRTELPYYMYCSNHCTPMTLGRFNLRRKSPETSRSIA